MFLKNYLGSCDFLESEGDSRKLKELQELVQHFSKQYRDYVPSKTKCIEMR